MNIVPIVIQKKKAAKKVALLYSNYDY